MEVENDGYRGVRKSKRLKCARSNSNHKVWYRVAKKCMRLGSRSRYTDNRAKLRFDYEKCENVEVLAVGV